MKDRVYVVEHKTKKLAYVGRTYRSLQARWNEHLKGAQDQRSTKLLSEAMKLDPGGFEIRELECSDTASEAAWLKHYTDLGYELLNEQGGNARAPKARNTAKEREWRDANKNAETALKPRRPATLEELIDAYAKVYASRSEAERYARSFVSKVNLKKLDAERFSGRETAASDARVPTGTDSRAA